MKQEIETKARARYDVLKAKNFSVGLTFDELIEFGKLKERLKKAGVALLLILAFACSSENDPQPAKLAPGTTQTGTGCQAIISKNLHTQGQEIKIKAEFAGCHDDVVLEARNDASSYRQGAACDVTEKAIYFAYTGTVLKVGLYPCGGTGANSGASYTLTIENSGVVTKINAKVGNVNLYTVK